MRTYILFLTAMLTMSIIACSGSGSENPVSPQSKEVKTSTISAGSNRYVWGFWDVYVSETQIEIAPVRAAGTHFNVVRMLETEPCTDCLKVKNFHVIDQNNWVFDLELTHPFPNMPKYTGFDVRGIFITDADYEFPQSGCRIAWGDSVPKLVNADGYTRLFNPTEYEPTDPACWGYIQGKYATGDDLSATLNPFIAYSKDNERRIFFAGSSEARTVHIRKPTGPIQFGYAVDASWALPTTEPVTDPVNDFPPEANCSEAYELRVQVGSGLGESIGATVPIEVEVFDHQGLDTIYKVWMEAPDLFDPPKEQVELTYKETTTNGGLLFTGNVTNEVGAASGEYLILVWAVDTATMGAVNMWQTYTITVGAKRGWVQTLGSEGYDHGVAVATDSNSIYVGGYLHTDNDPFLGSNSFISKIGSNGNFLWIRTWGGTEMYFESAKDIHVSATGVYVVGLFRGLVDFDPSSGEDKHDSGQFEDAYLTKFSPNGDFLWARTWGSNLGGDEARAVVSTQNDVYVCGYFDGVVDFDPGPGEDWHTSNGAIDIFLSKFTSTGDFQWARTWGGEEGYDSAKSILTDGFSLYITGDFGGTVDFDPSSGENIHTSNGKSDVFFSKFDSEGNFLWAKTWGGTNVESSYLYDSGDGITSDDNFNYIYIAGCFTGLVDFDPNSGERWIDSNEGTDTFLSKFDTNGNFQWVRTWGDVTSYSYCEGTSVDFFDNGIYVCGYFSGTVDFNPTSDIQSYISTGEDAFLSKFNPDGNFQWARAWGGTGDDSYVYDASLHVEAENEGVYITGAFSQLIDFDPTLGTEWKMSLGYSDIYLLKTTTDGLW